MKVFFAFVKKEFYHIFRDKRTLIVLFGMPLAQLLLFGFAITTEVSNAKMVIYNQSPGQFSNQLIERLHSSDFFKIAKNVDSVEEIEDIFRTDKAKIAIIIPPKFEEKFYKQEADIQLITDGTDPNLGTILSNSATAIVMKWAQQKSGREYPYELINADVRWHYNPSLESAEMFVPGVITIILMLVSAMLTSISIAREKELGTIETLFVSPLKPIVIIIGKVVPYMLLSLLNAVFILLMAWLIFDIPVKGSYVLLMLESLLFIITALSLGIFISTVVESQQMALMLSLFGLMLPTILLSGFIFPVSNMPIPLQVISNVIPAKFYLIIIKAIMLKGVGIMYIWKETLVLIFMSVFLIVLSKKKFKIRLQ